MNTKSRIVIYFSQIQIIVLCVFLINSCSENKSTSGPVLGKSELTVTSLAGDRLTSRNDLDIVDAGRIKVPNIFILNKEVKFQTIDGFGASFLEAGLKTLNTIPDIAQQDQVLKKTFDKYEGAGFSLMKTVIGSTDFQSASQNWYSYAEIPGDINLINFSIERDLASNGLVTYIRRAKQNGGEFLIQATMDYPPDWMLIDVNSNQNVNPNYYSSLANYYVKYIESYENQEIHIDALSPFNEPGVYTKISYNEIRDLIKDNIGPAFTTKNLSTALMLSETFSRGDAGANYPTVLDDPDAGKYISIVPYHGYFWDNYDSIFTLTRKYPEKRFWMTEVCCLIWKPGGIGFSSGNTLADSIISDLEAGASGWIFWNMILDETGGPWLVSPIHNDPDPNPQDSLIVINKNTHEILYTELFYYLAHFSKFIRPGSIRIETISKAQDGVRAISFVDNEGSIVTQLLNSTPSMKYVEINFGKCSIFVKSHSVSISTLKWITPPSC